jgi:phosphoribosylaminoimidazole (AIR) synthetase
MESDEALSKGVDLDESVVEIFSWLSKFGEIHTSKFNEKNNKWLGFGYVMFCSQEACDKALEYDFTNESED